MSAASAQLPEQKPGMAVRSIDELIHQRFNSTITVHISAIGMAKLVEYSQISGATLQFITKKIPRDLVARSIDINPTNLSKLYQRENLSRSQTEELNGLTEQWQEVLFGLFKGDRELMGKWLDTPVPALDGSTPRSLLSTFAGRRVLEGYIQNIRYGDYS